MSVEEQKQVADKVLEDLFLIDPYAIVAGGAPRDWHFNEEASDIDVFFCAGRTITLSTMSKMLSRHFPLPSKCVYEEDLPVSYEKNEALRSVRSYVLNGVSVQLIELHTSTFKIVDTFPVNMSKAWYKDGNIHLERDFILGEKAKALYITNKLYGMGDLYIKKITEKFCGAKGFSWCSSKELAEQSLLCKVLYS